MSKETKSFLDDFEEDDYSEYWECEFCGGVNGHHHAGCPESIDPYGELIKNGYD